MSRKAHRLFAGALTLCATLALIAGCTKARKAGGHMDTPETHYAQGMKYWDDGDYEKAAEEFELSRSLDPKFAPAYAGLALTAAHAARDADDTEAMKKGFKEAHELANKAKKLGDKIPEPFIAKALVITMENEGRRPPKKWLDEVEDEYKKAIKADPDNAEAYYRRGLCYKNAYEFDKAADDFRKVLDLDKDFTGEADRAWKHVQRIQRAAPGTEVGKRIALIDQITRADIAALFVSEMNIDKLIDKRRPANDDTAFEAPEDPRAMETETTVSMAQITDMDNHWAKNFVMDIVELEIRGLEPYPDHTFHPDEPVNRGEYAMMVEDVLIAILGDESLATKHIGSESRFPDVNASHPAYNAVCNAVDKGVMDAAMNGEFGLADPVSGAEALLVIRKIKDLNAID
jgi:hypothetical protein